MATQIQLRRGTTVQHSSFTGAIAEVTVDTDKETVVVHDGSTAGGFPLATETQVSDRLQVANANVTFVTKAVAVTSNNAVVALVNDRLQVSNAAATYQTIANEQSNLANTNAYIASVQTALDTQEAKQASDLANTNSYIADVQTNINVQIGSSNTSIRNFANQTFETKSVALAANNAQNSLILDRLQVSNAASLFVNVSGDTMSGALAMGTNKITGLGNPTAAQDAATKTYVDTEVANIVDSAPEALNTLNELAAALGDDANFATTTATTLGTKAANTYVNATFATKAYAAANTYVNAQVGAANTNIRTYANQTFETKSVALSANNAQNALINDRIQVANARVEFLQSSNTTITNDASSITTTQSNVDLSDQALVNPAGFITLNIGGTNYKIPFYS